MGNGKEEKKRPFKIKKINEKDSTQVNEKKPKLDKNGNPKKEKKLGWKIFKVCIFVLLALIIIGVGIVFGVISGIIDNTNSIELDELKLQNLTSKMYDKNDSEIASIFLDENRVMIKYQDMPKYLVEAVTSIEDERFFTHNGVDIKRTLGAIVTFVLNGGKSDFGGSTITQQLVKTIKEDDELNWQRKIREWYRAFTLEGKLSKEEILESYLNTIYLGEGAYGIEVASRTYFGKSVKDLYIEEAATLAAAIQSPEATNPYKSEEAKEKLLARQKIVLKKMLELGKLTQEQYDQVSNYDVYFTKGDIDTGKTNSYFVDAVIEQVITDLMTQRGIDRGVAIKQLYSDGLQIYTTQDQQVQTAIDQAYQNDKIFYIDKQGDFMQSSMVVMDQSTGNVVGLIGGAGNKSGNRVFNRATQLLRQPGSCMKPIGAYGPAFEQGVLAPGMGLDDCQMTLGNWTPKNYYPGFVGYVTARDALANSRNLPAVRATQRVGIEAAFLFAKNLGITVVEADKSLPCLALGGVTHGFSVLQMCTAYATFANGGIYMTPKLYTKVLDKNGKEILKPDTTAKRVMKDSTAYMITDTLTTTIKNGTATRYISAGNMPLAGKTGNTNGDIDQWFIGYTPYYTIACWNGYDEVGGKPGTKAINRVYPYASMRLFNTVVNAISAGQPTKQFERPASVINGTVCQVSGLVVTDACKADPRGSQARTDMFATGTVPTATCNIHKMAKVCKETGLLVTEFCPDAIERSFITRDYVPNAKPGDWAYMIPTKTCDVHTKAPEVKPPEKEPEDPDDGVDIYKDPNGNKKPSAGDKKNN